jgi:hypothetical protein
MQAVKFKDGTKDIIEGMLAPFGGPDFLDNKDFDGEFFDSDTNFELEWFGDWDRPVLFAHGTDEALKTSVVGRLKVTPTETGLWAEAKLDEAHAYKEAISELVEKGAVGWSAGSVERFYNAGLDHESGHIKHFPVIEGSLVTMPSNPLAADAHYASKSADIAEHLKVLGVAVPEALAEPAEEDDPETDHEPVEEEATKALDDLTDLAIKAITTALNPQSLHDAAVANGAECASEVAAEPPMLALAPAGNGAEKSVDIDLEALQAMVAAAVKETVDEQL